MLIIRPLSSYIFDIVCKKAQTKYWYLCFEFSDEKKQAIDIVKRSLLVGPKEHI